MRFELKNHLYSNWPLTDHSYEYPSWNPYRSPSELTENNKVARLVQNTFSVHSTTIKYENKKWKKKNVRIEKQSNRELQRLTELQQCKT